MRLQKRIVRAARNKTRVCRSGAEATLPLHPSPGQPHLGACVQVWAPRSGKDVERPERVQARATKIPRGQRDLREKAGRTGI